MAEVYTPPTLDEVIGEQQAVQADKNQERLLPDYNSYLFAGQTWEVPRGSPIVDFVRPIVGDVTPVSLEAVIEGLGALDDDQPLHWADMGGGRALAMRQLATMPKFNQKVQMTNVDLFDWGAFDLTPEMLWHAESIAPGLTDTDMAPALIRERAETVELPENPELITSVESIQYLFDPLRALVNWYNQLADDGVMFIAAEHEWMGRIKYHRPTARVIFGETPADHVLAELSKGEINFAAMRTADWEDGTRQDADPHTVRVLAIQKKPETALRLTRPVTRVWYNPNRYKFVYYELGDDSAPPIVEVVANN